MQDSCYFRPLGTRQQGHSVFSFIDSLALEVSLKQVKMCMQSYLFFLAVCISGLQFITIEIYRSVLIFFFFSGYLSIQNSQNQKNSVSSSWNTVFSRKPSHQCTCTESDHIKCILRWFVRLCYVWYMTRYSHHIYY